MTQGFLSRPQPVKVDADDVAARECSRKQVDPRRPKAKPNDHNRARCMEPTIVLKAFDTPQYRNVVDEALAWRQGQSGDATRAGAARSARSLRWSQVEVDGDLSSNLATSVARDHQIIDDAYKQRGRLAQAWLSNSRRCAGSTGGSETDCAPRMYRGSAVMRPGDHSLVKPTTGQFTRFPVVFTGPPAGLTSKPDALLASRSSPSVISFR